MATNLANVNIPPDECRKVPTESGGNPRNLPPRGG